MSSLWWQVLTTWPLSLVPSLEVFKCRWEEIWDSPSLFSSDPFLYLSKSFHVSLSYTPPFVFIDFPVGNLSRQKENLRPGTHYPASITLLSFLWQVPLISCGILAQRKPSCAFWLVRVTTLLSLTRKSNLAACLWKVTNRHYPTHQNGESGFRCISVFSVKLGPLFVAWADILATLKLGFVWYTKLRREGILHAF